MSQSTYKPKNRTVNVKPKRIQVADDDGWTHITTSGGHGKTGRDRSKNNKKPPALHDKLLPAETPRNLSFQGLVEQFQLHKQRWDESQCNAMVRRGLESALLRSGKIKRIGKCVCIGLGSPSGFLRGGWVDRRSVSLYQLAALVSVLEWISSSSPTGPKINIKQSHAQDPVFNKMDKRLLSSLNIHVVEDPAAFDLVDQDAFLYCPGAERSHLVDLLKKDPALFFGGPLEGGGQSLLNNEEETILSEFTQTRESIKLPTFGQDERAFWNMSLYWKRDDDLNE